MDETIEDYVDHNLERVSRFISETNTLYIKGYRGNDKYMISKNKTYIFTLNNKYVIITISPDILLKVIKTIIAKEPYRVDDFTKMVASLSGNVTLN